MSMPGDVMISTASIPGMLSPDDLGKPSRLADYEEGGIALNDPSQGIQGHIWRVRVDKNDVKISISPYITETVVFSVPGIKEISFAFDQNMRVSIGYIVEETAYLYWYDSVPQTHVTTVIASNATSIYLTMDDKRPAASALGFNDVLAFYARVGLLCYKQQRDRFQIERIVHDNAGVPISITRCGMNKGLRMQVEINGPEV